MQLAVIVMADADGAAYARRTTARTRSKGPIRRRVRCPMSKPAQEERPCACSACFASAGQSVDLACLACVSTVEWKSVACTYIAHVPTQQ